MPSDTPVPAISRKIHPPLWLAAGLALQYGTDRLAPIARIIPQPFNWLGLAVVVAGVGLIIWCIALFNRAKTGLVPFSESTTLLASGPYRVSRNPIYLGMALTLLGSAIAFGSLTPFLVVPAFVWLITTLFVIHEEVHMESAFGESYLGFKNSVRRWF
jgi:protein-S-isoprenylcysteine O-methyltransferase Ste14